MTCLGSRRRRELNARGGATVAQRPLQGPAQQLGENTAAEAGRGGGTHVCVRVHPLVCLCVRVSVCACVCLLSLAPPPPFLLKADLTFPAITSTIERPLLLT